MEASLKCYILPNDPVGHNKPVAELLLHVRFTSVLGAV
jgi:hypothetical protein